MPQDTHIQIRISESDKEESRNVFDSMGLTFSGAIKLFLNKVIQERKLPFAVTAGDKKKSVTPVKNSVKKTSLEKPTKKAETASEWNSFTKRRIGL